MHLRRKVNAIAKQSSLKEEYTPKHNRQDNQKQKTNHKTVFLYLAKMLLQTMTDDRVEAIDFAAMERVK